MTHWRRVFSPFKRLARAVSVLPLRSAAPVAQIQGYVDEIAGGRVTGWARDPHDPAARVTLEIFLDLPEGERCLGQTEANLFYKPISESGFGDGRYGFQFELPTDMPLAALPALAVRPLGSGTSLPRGAAFQGFVDQRSQHHVAGWVRNRFAPAERVQVEAVLLSPAGERILARGVADRFYRALAHQQVGDGLYGFFLLFPEALDEAARGQVIVRPVGEAAPLQISPSLAEQFDLFSYSAMDIVNNCNLRCPFCLFDYGDTKSTRFMSEEVFDSALRLAPLVADGGFWLSCLHEPSLHPKFLDFIERVPRHLRRKLMFTTNLAKRMPASYFEALAQSGVYHINISIESLDPPVYEKFRKGARFPIFKENWDRMIAAWRAAPNPPKLRYVTMAYQSNCREIPALVKYLLEERLAWQIEVRYTFDLEHIPGNFKQSEYLHEADWRWLAEALAGYSGEQVLLVPPSDLPETAPVAMPAPDILPATAATRELPVSVLRAVAPVAGSQLPVLPLNAQIKWDGSMVICDKWEHPSEPTHKIALGNIKQLADPIEFLQRIAGEKVPDSIYGYIDEISASGVTGWVRNYSHPAQLVGFEVVLALPKGDRVIAAGIADQFCQALQDAGYHDPCHGFRIEFPEPLTAGQRDCLEVRPAGTPVILRRAPKYQGYVDQRSLRHVQGWIRNRFDPEERVAYEVVDISQKFERVLGQGIADLYDAEIAKERIGDAEYGFCFLFDPPLSEAVRDAVIVRPLNRPLPLALSPRLVTEFLPSGEPLAR